jgi:hypothetical protein
MDIDEKHGSLKTRTTSAMSPLSVASVPDPEKSSRFAADPESDATPDKQKAEDGDEVLTEDVQQYRAQLNARFWLWAPCMMIGFVASGMDESIQTSATTLIGAEFNSLNQMSWLGTAWFIGVLTGYPLWCSWCDIYGRKTPIVLYHAFYLLGLFLAGFANSMVMLSVLLLPS